MASITSTQGVSMDEKSSPTTSGPDSDVASVEEDLPNDNVSEEGNTPSLFKDAEKEENLLSFFLCEKLKQKDLFIYLLFFCRNNCRNARRFVYKSKRRSKLHWLHVQFCMDENCQNCQRCHNFKFYLFYHCIQQSWWKW